MKYNIIEFTSVIQDGGAETLMKDYASLVDKEKFNICIVAKRILEESANGKILKGQRINSIELYKKWNIFSSLYDRIMGEWYVSKTLKQIMRKNKTDVLHIHLQQLHYVRRIAKSIPNIKLVYTCHNQPEQMFDSKEELESAKYLVQNNGMQIIALHEDMRRELNKLLEIDNTIIIKNGIDFSRFKVYRGGAAMAKQKVGIKENAFVVGHVGRFAQQKNHSFLIEIFAEICKRRNNAFLLLIGTGELKQDITNMLNRLGLRNKYMMLYHRDDVPELLQAMDVFVFPSFYEGLSLSLVEAQVSGLRCIVSDKINSSNFLSEKTIPMSLSDGPERWCNEILYPSLEGRVYGDINEYDMNREIRKLEMVYTGLIEENIIN